MLKLKKILSITFSMLILFSCISSGFYTFSVNAESRNIKSFSAGINSLIENYDDEEEYIDDVIGDRLIVSAKSLSEDYNALETVSGLGYTVLQYSDDNDADEAKKLLESNGYTVEYDMVYTCFDVTSTDETSSKWANERVESKETLNAIKSSGKTLSDVTVGIIDTGVDYTHALLKDRIDNTSLNFSSSGNNNDCMDEKGHGTMVAGVVAQNTTDNVKIQPYKLMNKNGQCTNSQIISVFTHILNDKNAPDIINMSFGVKSTTPNLIFTDLVNKIINKGIVAVAAAGNDNITTEKIFPANVENVISVSASDIDNRKCSFSNYGTGIDLAAPGYKVYTSKMGGGYSLSNGTSFSAPLVAAACATVLMQDSSLTAKAVEGKIKAACIGFDNTYTDVDWCGSGILNYRGLFEDNLINSPVFNYQGDIYNSEIELTMTAPENSKIIYTTDYSIPSLTNGTEYTDPITISGNQHIIAVATDGENQSKYVGETYQIVYTPDDSEFTISSNGNITKYKGNKDSITVPDTVNGITVSGVDISAFKESSLTYIELPETATLIRQNAFASSSICTIIAPGITKVDAYAFRGCANLVHVSMPNVLTCGREVFYGCTMLDSVDFNDTVEEIGYLSFASTNFQNACFPKLTNVLNIFKGSNLFSADLPNANRISGTFDNCINLKTVNIPNVTVIGDDTFNRCKSLTKMDFSKIQVIENGGLSGSYFNEIILDNCTELGANAFAYCTAKYISIPEIDTINEGTFNQCVYLVFADMPNVTTFANSSSANYFCNCLNLEELYLPKSAFCPTINWDANGVATIEDGAVPALRFIYAPNAVSVESSNSKVFLQYCKNLRFAYLPKVTSANKMAEIPNSIWYFTGAMTNLPNDTTGYGYTIVAPGNSYAQTWAEEYGHRFVDCKNASLSSVEGGNLIYTSSLNGCTCEIPVWLAEEMWNEYLPINYEKDFYEYGFMLDVVTDGVINAKDYAFIKQINE